MKIKSLLFIVAIATLSLQPLKAQVSVEGDFLVDDTNQREWVRLYITQGMSHNEVQFETQPGRMFEGFQIATAADFLELVDATENIVVNDLPLHSPEYPQEYLGNSSITHVYFDMFTGMIGGTQGILTSELSAAGEKDAFAFTEMGSSRYYETESFAANISQEGYGVMLYREFCDPCAPLLGDVNLDGSVNLLDVQPFVTIITNGGFQNEADINIDGVVDLLDVQPFVEIISGG